jgi:hypothetical protein
MPQEESVLLDINGAVSGRKEAACRRPSNAKMLAGAAALVLVAVVAISMTAYKADQRWVLLQFKVKL